ncbi:uncharacterized protein PHALS_04811 [Plasmopara halstedii]|uniref:Uncharacterized protein n=1 Tax=Plasmopara halstedii TaxID=4781 RepID=A0A0P1B163_PLAHL|nr:uncharacterized protein PHALS_04811 [Plasmopara halstedii]CEG47663.1 hypothetical protein PHALS_04811 [Plasmopara halstedii]|eukprot:XP_024584032.1 hypothetical protein PHALS_04811 [Plasmopara halstedii]
MTYTAIPCPAACSKQNNNAFDKEQVVVEPQGNTGVGNCKTLQRTKSLPHAFVFVASSLFR